MSKLFLNLSQMKKVKEGKDTTVFEHKDGHQVHVKNSALSPKMKDEMQKLALGGKAKKSPAMMAEGGMPCKNPACKSCGQEHPNCRCYAKGGPVRYADGGNVSDKDKTINDLIGNPFGPPSPRPSPAAPTQYADNVQDSPEQIAADAAGNAPVFQAPEQVPPGADFQLAKGADPTAAPQQPGDKSLLDYLKPGSALSDSDRAANAVARGETPTLSARQSNPTGEVDQEPVTPPTTKTKQQPGDAYQTGVGRGIAEQRQGIDKEAQARSLQSEQTLQGLQQGAADKASDDSFYREQQDDLLAERTNLMRDYKAGHIKPNQFIAEQGVPAKISTAIGLLLGGIGGGLLHQENPALKFLNAQIDRNINAQQAELGKKHNLLSANYQQFQNLQSARDFTRINHNDMIKNLVDQAAAKAGTPMAQAEALKLKGQLDQNSGLLMAKIGAMNTINHSAAGEGDINSALQTLRFTDPEKAKEVEGRLIPGVGLSQVPLTAEDRSDILGKKQFNDQVSNMINWVKQNSGTVMDRAKVNEGKAMAAELATAYRNASHGGVYKEGEQHFINTLIPDDPAQFFGAIRTIPKLMELQNNNSQRYKSALSLKGVTHFNGQQSATPPDRFTVKSAKPKAINGR